MISIIRCTHMAAWKHRWNGCLNARFASRERINFRHVGGQPQEIRPADFYDTMRHALMEIWFCFPVTEVERSVGTAAPGAAGAAAGGSRGLSPSPAPSSPSTPVATSSPSVSSASSSPSPSTSASALVAGLDKSVLQVSSLTYTRAWSCQDNVTERYIRRKGTYMGYFFLLYAT